MRALSARLVFGPPNARQFQPFPGTPPRSSRRSRNPPTFMEPIASRQHLAWLAALAWFVKNLGMNKKNEKVQEWNKTLWYEFTPVTFS